MKIIRPNLWFNGNAEEAAEFYCSLFPDSHIENVIRSPVSNPYTQKGEVVVVEFTLFGRPFAGINGGSQFEFNEAVSLEIECDDQDEVDHYWETLIAGGGSPSQCGWCKDRFGLSWQIIPRRLKEMMESPDPEAAERAMQAMLTMGKIDIKILERAFDGK